MLSIFRCVRLAAMSGVLAIVPFVSGCTREPDLSHSPALTEAFDEALRERASDLSVWKIELRCRDVEKPLRAIVYDTSNTKTEVEAGVTCSETGRLAELSFESGPGYVVSSRYSYDKAVVLDAFSNAITARFGTLQYDANSSNSATQEYRALLASNLVEELEFTCQSSTQRFRYAGVVGRKAKEGGTSMSCKPEAVEKGSPSILVVRRTQPIPSGAPEVDMFFYKVYATKDVGEGVALKLVGEVASALGPRKTF